MAPTKLFLDQHYNIDGVTVTGEDIKNMMIDNIIMKERLSKEGDSE